MAVVDREGTVVDANPAFGELLGAAAEELAGAQAADLVDLASDARTWHSYREVLRGRQAKLRCKRRLKHPDGHSMWAQITITPLAEGSQGSPVSCCPSPTSRPVVNSRPGCGTCRCTTR